MHISRQLIATDPLEDHSPTAPDKSKTRAANTKRYLHWRKRARSHRVKDKRSSLFALLIIANETGRRIGSIRHLRAGDVDLANVNKKEHPYGTITWPAEFDKQSVEWERVPNDYVSVGFTYYQGADSGWAVHQADIPNPPRPGSLDEAMALVGLPMFVLDLRSVPREGLAYEWLNQLRGHRMSVPEYVQLNPLQAWDALFHIDRISPVQLEAAPK